MHDYLETLRKAVAAQGAAAVARVLGVHAGTLTNVLAGSGRPSTRAAVREAYVKKAAELEGLR